MKVRSAFFAILVGGLVLMPFSVGMAIVDPRGVDEVLKKSVLTADDLAVVDDFVLDVVVEIVRTDDFTQIAAPRALLLARQGTQTQYAQQLLESARKHILAELQKAQGIADPARRFKVIVNLLILVDGLKDPRLADIAAGMIPHESSAVRYWAVRAATDQTLWSKLGQNQAGAGQLAGRIVAECGRAVESSRPEVLSLMAEFAGRFNTAEAEGLLVRVADERIKRYAAWQAQYEMADAAILKVLAGKLTPGGTANPELARRFAQLYSFIIQRYIKGQQLNALSGASKGYLASAIMDVEDKCLSKLLGARQPGLTKALQETNLEALQAGALVAALGVNYGPAGSNRPTPLPLPDPPARQAPAAAPPQP
jgi:hypothetical protein